MPITLKLAMQLPKLRHLTPSEAGARLGVPLAEVEEAARMLTLPMGPPESRAPLPSHAEREAAIDKLPKKMQERIRRARG